MARVRVQVPIDDDSPEESLDRQQEQRGNEEVKEQKRPVANTATKKPLLTPRNALIAATAAVLLLVVVLIVGLINDRNSLREEVSKLSSSSQPATDNEAEELKAEVSQLIELPADETPTVATVVDASKVKNQAFFANSQNNDKVLIFAKAGKAILYRPSAKKIIEVAPINLGADGQQQSPQATPSN